MGRRSSSYETYELSAFTEQVLLDAGEGNGSNLGVGDSFTMPTESNAVITVSDNDGTLSGDSRNNENATDRRGQEATITVDGEEVGGNGQIYAEQFFWVCDEAGNWYILLEIEQEDSSGDYFVFYDYCGLPDEGAELSIVCARNITNCWEPRYDDMMQEPPFAPPIALNDLISITEDESIGDASADAQLNVLANDFDIDSDFALTGVTGGTVGQAFDVTTAGGVTVSVTIAADGTLSFDAAGQFDALNLGESDSFVIEYTISDADGGSNSAEVTVVINGTPDGPVAVADSFITTESGTITGNILDNDDGNGNDMSVVSISANGETYEPGDSFEVTTDGGRTGTVTVEADGSLTFTTDGNFDDLSTDQTDTVTLSYTVAGGQSGENLIVNGDFENHGELTRGSGENRWDVFNSLEGWSTPTGELEIQQGTHGGTPENSTTNSVIELDSHDSCDTNAAISQTVTIGQDGVYTLSFDYSPRQLGDLIGETSGIAVIVDGEVIASFSSDTLGYENYSFDLDLGAGDHVVGFAGTGVDDTFGALLDNVELRGQALTDSAEVTLTIVGENEGPAAADDGFAVTEANGSFDVITGDVLANDTDADGDALTVTGVNGDTSAVGQVIDVSSDENGFAATVTIAADGTISLDASDDFAELTTGESDTVTVSYTISDGAGGTDTATVTLTVNGGNEGPVAADDSFEITEADGTVGEASGNVLSNDTDADGDALTVTGVNGDAASVGQTVNVTSDVNGFAATVTIAADGTITLDASDEFAAMTTGESDTVTVSYEVSDGEGGTDTATVTLTVNGGNEGPVAADDSFEITEANATFADVTGNVLTNDTDVDGDALTVTGVNGDAASVGQTINVVSDVNGFAATVSIAADGTVTLSASDEFAALSDDETDTITVSYEVSDGEGGVDTATVVLDVNGVNAAPIAVEDEFETSETATGFETVTGNLLANDSDPDGDSFTVTAIDGYAASVGQLIELETDDLGLTVEAFIAADGSITLTPGSDVASQLTDGESDFVEFSYEITDANGATSEATATFVINGANIAPDAQDLTFTSTEQSDGTVPESTGNLLEDATDADGDNLTVSAINGDASLIGEELNLTSNENGFDVSVVIDANGDISLNPGTAFAGLDEGEEETVTFDYEVSDGNGGVDTASVTLTVTGIEGNGGPGGGGGTGQGNTSYNVVFIVDTSGSATQDVFGSDSDTFFGNLPTDQHNLNQDGIERSQADAELYTVQQISDQIASLDLSDDIDIGVYTSNLESTGPGTFIGARGLSDADGNVQFDAGEDLTDIFDGAHGNGSMIVNSAISGANDWLTIANADDQYDTTVNIVYVLSASTGLTFPAALLQDADADLAGELSQMDANFDFTIDTIFFDGDESTISPEMATLEGYGDGTTNIIDGFGDLAGVLDGVGDVLEGTVGTVSGLVDDIIDTTTGIIDDLVS